MIAFRWSEEVEGAEEEKDSGQNRRYRKIEIEEEEAEKKKKKRKRRRSKREEEDEAVTRKLRDKNVKRHHPAIEQIDSNDYSFSLFVSTLPIPTVASP